MYYNNPWLINNDWGYDNWGINEPFLYNGYYGPRYMRGFRYRRMFPRRWMFRNRRFW